MTDPPHYPDSKSDRADDPGTPRWVKVFGIIALAVVLLFATMMLAGGGPGGHGPGRHMPSGGAPPANVTGDDRSSGGGAGGQTPPVAHGAQRP